MVTIYYSVTFSLDSLGLDIYTNTLIVACCELAGYLANTIFITKL